MSLKGERKVSRTHTSLIGD